MSIFDVHTHPICIREGQRRRDVPDLIARAGRHGIDRMVVLGDVLAFGRSPTLQQVRFINDDTARLIKNHPNTFIGFCHLNPTLGACAVETEVERCAEKGFRGIKLEVANNARAACMRPVMKAAERHDLIVLQHAWSMVKIRERSFHTDPADAALLAKRFPNVRVIMAHLTGCGVRGVLEASGIENLWVDTSGAAPESGVVEYAVEKLGAKKILYGSDAPIRDFAVAIARVTGSALSASEKRAILHDNAHDLFRLP